jgi:hypothetical protein
MNFFNLFFFFLILALISRNACRLRQTRHPQTGLRPYKPLKKKSKSLMIAILCTFRDHKTHPTPFILSRSVNPKTQKKNTHFNLCPGSCWPSYNFFFSHFLTSTIANFRTHGRENPKPDAAPVGAINLGLGAPVQRFLNKNIFRTVS